MSRGCRLRAAQRRPRPPPVTRTGERVGIDYTNARALGVALARRRGGSAPARSALLAAVQRLGHLLVFAMPIAPASVAPMRAVSAGLAIMGGADGLWPLLRPHRSSRPAASATGRSGTGSRFLIADREQPPRPRRPRSSSPRSPPPDAVDRGANVVLLPGRERLGPTAKSDGGGTMRPDTRRCAMRCRVGDASHCKPARDVLPAR